MPGAAQKPKPFVKWAGGKRQLLEVLLKNVPARFNTYIEPFVGGGALLFALLPDRAIIGDANCELINAYSVIKDNVEELITSLERHRNDEDYYYEIRNLDPSTLSPVERASRFIYLNKTCYNGLYRENSKGMFNVPFGRYKNPKILDRDNLRAVSEFLNSSNVLILCQDYRETCKLAGEGDFVYLDPPYHPLSRTASFTKYSRNDFSEEDQERLAEVFRELDRKGCYVMLSNSNTEFIKSLYRGYYIQELEASRAINCKGDGRRRRKIELLIKNY
ncbi:DNA adenine methylase [Hydrogenivirga sp. 128-5-R1-1]|uniref:DNA adenine methylase n=1 Tax=Hydrogenivirga sp. 128-5-R1-1 TaxID=392423 RepID=UPI00015F39FE|nr:DNA adenine methylase [Hydrogenivirga sp. 128-5-R1-1]EDP75067.1 DNA adenine methylase [Hydrogenivirga sp. 128-5-R1-1]